MDLGPRPCFATARLGLTSLFAFTTQSEEQGVIKSIRRISSKTSVLV